MDHTEAQHLIPTNRGPMSAAGVVDHLTYCSYAHQRDESPDVAPERWSSIFSNVPAMEARYQRELRLRALKVAEAYFRAQAGMCVGYRAHSRRKADSEALIRSERHFVTLAKAARRKAARVVRIGGAA